MSHSGSSEYPLPLSRPTTTSLPLSSKLANVQNSVEHQSTGVKNPSKSAGSSLSKDTSQESLEIYSVHNHQRHKRQPPSANTSEKNLINNNYGPEKV